MKKKSFIKFMLLAVIMLVVGSVSVCGQKITDVANIVSGQSYYIGATTGGTDYYLSVSGDGSTIGASLAGTAVNKASANIFTFVGSGSTWTIQFDSDNYLSLKTSKDNGKVSVQATAANFIISNQNSLLKMGISTSYSIQKNNSTTNFGNYGNTQTYVWLEPAVASCTPSSTSFTSSSVSKLTTDAAFTNTFTTNNTSAKAFTSTNTSVATVNETTGEVTIVGAGTTTIGVTQVADATYCAVSSSYALSVSAPSYTITPTSNNESFGTVSLSGTVITATPASGYTYASPAYTVLSGTATVSQNGNNFTVTPTSNCAIRINFEAIPTYTVTFDKGTGNCATASLTESLGGGGVTLPTATPSATCAAQNWEFAGWAAAAQSESTSSPTLYAAGSTYNPVSNLTLYAVYKITEGGGSGTVTINRSSLPSGSAYVESTWTSVASTGETVTGKMKPYLTTTSYIQISGTNTPFPYNIDAIPGAITNISITMPNSGSLRTWTPYLSSSSSLTSTSGGTALAAKTFTAVSTTLSWDIESSNDYKYFYLNTNGNTNIESFVISYGSSSTTYNSNPSCSSPSITVSETTLTGFTYAQGSGPSAEQSFTVSGVNLTENISIAASTNYEISKTSGSGYATPLTFTHSGGTVAEQTVYVRLKSGLTQGTFNDEVINITSDGATTKTVTASGSVTAAPIAEPSNHATGFTATTNSTTEITVTWTDASGGADSYLVKGSSVSAESITAPVDGTAEADAALVKNIASGVQSATFTGLTASTTYYFNIYPYNGTSTSINYKVDGSVPTSSEATATPLAAATATAATAVSTTGFTANWAAVSGATSYDVNVYTKEGGSDGVAVSQGFDAGTTAPTNWIFTGIGGTYTTNTNFGTTSPSLKFDADDDAVLTPTLPSSATELSFWMKGQGAADGSILLVEGYNGSAWVTIQSIVNPIGTGTTYLYTTTSSPALPSNLTQFRFTYTKESGNISFDDVTYKYGSVAENTPITNSPFNVTSATTKELTGLSSGTAYYYTVVAKDATSSSDASNEITVLTAIDGTLDASTLPDCPTCDLVVNNGGVVTLNAGKSYNSVSVKPGAKLTLNNGHSFSPGTFTLESNASATATFVDKRIHANITNITATVQQHLPAASTRTWWYLASPVSGAASTVFGSNKVGDYSETTRSYSNPFTEATTLTAGKGYVVKMTAASAANYVFENKTLNTGDISVALTRTVTETPDNAKRGFNLVGNPYPSYLNWDLAYNNSTNVRSTIWYRTLNGASMEFHTYNATLNASVPSSANGYIPPMQAFWVKVDKDPTEGSVSNGTLNFTNDMRSHDESALGNPLKAPAADRNLVRLSISNGTLSDETVIATHPSASDSYDRFDSEKMANGDTNRPEIFSMAGNQELVINGISPLTDSKQIALGVRPGRAGNYTINLTEWRNTGNMEVVLRDNQLGEELILTESSSYSFDTDGNASTSRFSLLFRAKGSNTGFDRISSDLLIYASQKSIRVESASLEGNAISIFNALGQPVFNGKAQSNRLEINGLTPAVYLVKVNHQTKMVIVK